MKIILSVLICFLFYGITKSQTYVTGGIFTNTTWTLSNTPYIVTDTVVVFPGVILTIEPGVEVRFADNARLEIRQGKLDANGTATDSITFTSNSPLPIPGIYRGIYINGGTTLQLTYCNFYYAILGLEAQSVNLIQHCKIMNNIDGIKVGGALVDSCDIVFNSGLGVYGSHDITNSTISNNISGLSNCTNIYNCFIDNNSSEGVSSSHGNILNCFIRNNQTGISHCGGSPGTIIDSCVIAYNLWGVHNPERDVKIRRCTIEWDSIGIELSYNIGQNGNNRFEQCQIEYNKIGIIDHNNDDPDIFVENVISNNDIGIESVVDSFSCNSICNNTIYDLKYLSVGNTNCFAHNYWCTPDSASTEAVIYDAYDDPSYGIVTFMPMDSACAPAITTSVNNIADKNNFILSPNPATDFVTVNFPEKLNNGNVKIFNTVGEMVYSVKRVSGIITIDVSKLISGTYIIQVATGESIYRQKLIKE
jgi:hypothetical protein